MNGVRSCLRSGLPPRWWALLLCLVALGGRGWGQRVSQDLGAFELTAEHVAASLKHGYSTVLLEVRSKVDVEVPVEVVARHPFGSDERGVAAWRTTIAPGGQASHRLLVPVFALEGQELNLNVRGLGTETWANVPSGIQLHGSEGDGRSERAHVGLFHVSGRPLEPSAALALAESLANRPLPVDSAFVPAGPRAAPNADAWHRAERLVAGPRGSITHSGPGFKMSWSGSNTGLVVGVAGTPSGAYAVRPLGLERLPARAVEWSSAGGVLLDLGYGSPTPAELEVLLTYARMGGVLLLIGLPSEALVRQIPQVAPHLEERLSLVRMEADDGAFEAFRLGLGVLGVSHASSARSASELLRKGIWWCFEREPRALLDGGTDWRLLRDGDSIVVPKVLSSGWLAAICLGLAVVIGPVNFLVVWRRRRPALLLKTVPVLSLGAALTIALVGLFRAGFDVRSSSASLAVLDQRTSDVAVVESRSIYAGFTLAEGLRPEPGTVVLPTFVGLPRMEDHVVHAGENGALLSGDFLPARRLAESTVLSVRRARARLDVEWGAAVRVTNGFDSNVQALVLRDRAGDLWRLPAALGPGLSAELVPAGEPDAQALLREIGPGPGHSLTRDLPRGSYGLLLGGADLVADLGLGFAGGVAGRHGVLGILEVPR